MLYGHVDGESIQILGCHWLQTINVCVYWEGGSKTMRGEKKLGGLGSTALKKGMTCCLLKITISN